MTAISDKYAQLGGTASFLGAQISAEIPAANGGRKQEFQNGTIYWHSNTGAFEVHGAISARWLALGGEGSVFGYPTSDETTAHDGVGKFNNFENASVFWHPSTGAFEVHGSIRDRWRTIGAETSILGYPTTNESTTPDGIGRFNHFQNGRFIGLPLRAHMKSMDLFAPDGQNFDGNVGFLDIQSRVLILKFGTGSHFLSHSFNTARSK